MFIYQRLSLFRFPINQLIMPLSKIIERSTTEKFTLGLLHPPCVISIRDRAKDANLKRNIKYVQSPLHTIDYFVETVIRRLKQKLELTTKTENTCNKWPPYLTDGILNMTVLLLQQRYNHKLREGWVFYFHQYQTDNFHDAWNCGK